MFAAFCSHASTNSTALAYGHFVLNLQHNIQGARHSKSGVGIYFSLDSKAQSYDMIRVSFALVLSRKRSKCRPLLQILSLYS